MPTEASSERPADPSLDEIENELARRDLISFTLRTKRNYRAGWFHSEVAVALDQFLDDVRNKRSPRLILTAPPQHGKTELTSRRFPAFAFGHDPELRIIGTAYAGSLAESFCLDIEKIVDSPEYVAIFPNTRILAENARSIRERRSAGDFTIVGHEGNYRAVGRGGGLTGRPAEILIVDDPIKDFEEAISDTIRESAFNWLTTTAMSRVQEGGGVICMSTRWHMDDPIGRLLAKQGKIEDGGVWTVKNFAAIAEEDELPHRQEGEPLSVERYSLESLVAIRDGGLINSYQWAALYQQHPSPLGGGIFKREDWRFYDVEVAQEFYEIVQSWDLAFKDTRDSDFVAGHVWGYKGANKFLIDRVNDRMTFGGTKTAIRTLSAKHPTAFRKFVEDKANGPAVIDDLKAEISGLIAVNPEGGKIARAHAVSGEVEAHNVYLPAMRNRMTGALDPLPWVHSLIEQSANFPAVAHDDDVDAMTQALAQIRKLSSGLHLSEGAIVGQARHPVLQRVHGNMKTKVF